VEGTFLKRWTFGTSISPCFVRANTKTYKCHPPLPSPKTLPRHVENTFFTSFERRVSVANDVTRSEPKSRSPHFGVLARRTVLNALVIVRTSEPFVVAMFTCGFYFQNDCGADCKSLLKTVVDQ